MTVYTGALSHKGLMERIVREDEDREIQRAVRRVASQVDIDSLANILQRMEVDQSLGSAGGDGVADTQDILEEMDAVPVDHELYDPPPSLSGDSVHIATGVRRRAGALHSLQQPLSQSLGHTGRHLAFGSGGSGHETRRLACRRALQLRGFRSQPRRWRLICSGAGLSHTCTCRHWTARIASPARRMQARLRSTRWRARLGCEFSLWRRCKDSPPIQRISHLNGCTPRLLHRAFRPCIRSALRGA